MFGGGSGEVEGGGLDWGCIKVLILLISNKELLVCSVKRNMEVGGVNIGGGGGWRQDAWGWHLRRWGGGGLVWGWIGVFLLVFSCRELLFYSAVVRLHSEVLGRDRVSWHGGDGWWMVTARGLGLGKVINGFCLNY